jgi:hypothetical protein
MRDCRCIAGPCGVGQAVWNEVHVGRRAHFKPFPTARLRSKRELLGDVGNRTHRRHIAPDDCYEEWNHAWGGRQQGARVTVVQG